MQNIPAQVRAPLSVVAWIACSSGLILFNKRLLAGWFPFPIVLTMFHMLFASVVTWSLRFSGLVTTPLVTFAVYRRMFVPIAALFAASLILSNYAYLYLSVSFIQMLKASTPIVVLLLSFAAGLRKVSLELTLVVLTVCVGVIMAAYGELLWSTIGVLLQVGGILVEAARLVTIQIVLKEVKLGPLDSLSLYAPACTLFLFTASMATGEMTRVLVLDKWVLSELLGNVLVAFALNLVTLWLVMETSSLVLTMCGVFKDILLIFASKLFFASLFTHIQVIGYSISLVAIYVFNQLSSAPPAPAPLSDDKESSSSPPWYSYLCSRHAIVGSFILLFFISGLAMSDTAKKPGNGATPSLQGPASFPNGTSNSPTDIPNYPPKQGNPNKSPTGSTITPSMETVPIASPVSIPAAAPVSQPFCRTQKTIRFSVDVHEGYTGGAEALSQLMVMVQEIVPLLPFPALANSLTPLERVDSRYRERYRHEYDIGFNHVPLHELGKDGDIFEIILAPEVQNCHMYQAPDRPLLRPNNSRVYIWQLAHRTITANCQYFAHTDWLRNDFNLHMEPWRLVRPYLSKDFYQISMDLGFLKYNGSIDVKTASPRKKNLILVDNDTPRDVTNYLRQRFIGRAAITVVEGFSVSALHALYTEAKVVVDWCLVGAERVPIEASLFGAVFTSGRCIGYPANDFPVGEEFFLETKELMGDKIELILQQWADEVVKQDKFRSYILAGKNTMRKDTLNFMEHISPPMCPDGNEPSIIEEESI